MRQICLSNSREWLHISERDWWAVLRLAQQYGWHGEATATPGCGIDPPAARALADALDEALPDVPRHDALSDKIDQSENANEADGADEDSFGYDEAESCELPLGMNLYEWFSGNQGRDILKRVIRLSYAGALFVVPPPRTPPRH